MNTSDTTRIITTPTPRTRQRPLLLRWLLALTLTLAAGGLMATPTPAYAQKGKKKSSKKKSSKKKASKKKATAKSPAPKDPTPAAGAPDQASANSAAPDAAPGNGAQQAKQPDSGDPGAPAAAANNDEATAAPSDTGDIDSLRQEYLQLRDELFRSKARAATVASAMYSTRIRVNLTYGSGRYYSVTRATLRLDGASVFDDTTGAIANDIAPRFEGFVAPGRHVLTVRIEATGKDDERFTTAVENTFSIQAPAAKDVTVTIKVKDDGDIAYAWQKKQRGSYQPSLSIAVTTADRATSAPAKTASKPGQAGRRTAEVPK